MLDHHLVCINTDSYVTMDMDKGKDMAECKKAWNKKKYKFEVEKEN